jgi:peptidoglycan/LPS O-acetylase OafA/YrhL
MSDRAAPRPVAHDAYLARKYFTELDGLRAFSVLLVITVHLYDAGALWAWLNGQRGVTIFFVLSGYLITTLALREEAGRGRVSLPAFYVRRCCRILPLYYVVLALHCLLLFGLAASPHQRQPFADALPNFLLYLQEAPIFLRDPAGPVPEVPFGHSWTLGIEEKFYLLWPVLAFLIWRGSAGFRRRGAAALAAALALAPVILAPFGPGAQAVGRMLFCYYSLLAGCLVALLLHDPGWFSRLRRLGGAGWTALVLLLFLAAHFLRGVPPSWLYPRDLLYTAAVAALLTCLLLGEGPLQRLLRWRPLAFVGRLSYGIYLIHMLCIPATYKLVSASTLGWTGSVLAFAATCLLSIAGAWVLQAAVEAPGIALGRRWSRRLTAKGGGQGSRSATATEACGAASGATPSPGSWMVRSA